MKRFHMKGKKKKPKTNQTQSVNILQHFILVKQVLNKKTKNPQKHTHKTNQKPSNQQANKKIQSFRDQRSNFPS